MLIVLVNRQYAGELLAGEFGRAFELTVSSFMYVEFGAPFGDS
jgi:hypothetical protein